MDIKLYYVLKDATLVVLSMVVWLSQRLLKRWRWRVESIHESWAMLNCEDLSQWRPSLQLWRPSVKITRLASTWKKNMTFCIKSSVIWPTDLSQQFSSTRFLSLEGDFFVLKTIIHTVTRVYPSIKNIGLMLGIGPVINRLPKPPKPRQRYESDPDSASDPSLPKQAAHRPWNRGGRQSGRVQMRISVSTFG